MVPGSDVLFFVEYLFMPVKLYATAVLVFLVILFAIIIIKRISNKIEIEIEKQKNAVEGENIEIKGKIKFHRLVKSVKWQKLQRNAEFIDINIHSTKYRGTLNDVKNPKLCITSVDVDDEADYRLALLLKSRKLYAEIWKEIVHSSTLSLKITKVKVPEITCNGKTEEVTCIYGESAIFKALIHNSEHILCITWQKETKFEAETLNTKELKYDGSTSSYTNPELHINNISFSDEGFFYLLATSSNNETKSNQIYLKVQGDRPDVSLSQRPEISVDVGEKVKYKSSIRCTPIPTHIVWMKGNNRVDIKEAKYSGSTEVVDNPIMIINDVNKDDEDIYSIEVHNAVGIGKARSIRLVVNDALPEVQHLSLSQDSPPMQYGNNIILKAEIKSSPKPKSIQWTRFYGKEIEVIDIKKEKYHNSDTCTLVINNLDYSDQGKYEINVTNAKGSVKKDYKIDVQGLPMVFISGPTVVSPSSTIEFLIEFTGDLRGIGQIWQKTAKNNKVIDIDFNINIKGEQKYIQSNSSSSDHNHKFFIQKAVSEDEAMYQFFDRTDKNKSNKINVFVNVNDKFATEGQTNCCRFLSLLSICADVMRDVFDKLQPQSFMDKWNSFQQNFPKWKLSTGKNQPTSSKDLDISLMYTIIRNGTKLSQPFNGWGKLPNVNRTTVADDIERIHWIRNEFSHVSSSEIDTSTFNKWTINLLKIIYRLSSKDKEIVEKLCSELNKVCYKGEDLREMQEELQKLREQFSKVEANLRKDDDKRHSTTAKLYIKERLKWKYRKVQDYGREIAKALDSIASRIEKTPFIDIVFEELDSKIASYEMSAETLSKDVLNFLKIISSSLRETRFRNETLLTLVHFLINFMKNLDYPYISVSCVSGFFSMNLELSSRDILESYQEYGCEEHLKKLLLKSSYLDWYNLTQDDIIIEEVKAFKNLDELQIHLYEPSMVKKGQCVQLRAMIVSCLSIADIEWKMQNTTGSKILDLSQQKYKGSVVSQTSAILQINDVDETDESEYGIKVSNTSGKSVTSNQVIFRVAKETPVVYLRGPEKLYFGETGTYFAHIENTGLINITVVWQKKDKCGMVTDIDVTDEKYRGSSVDLPTPVLIVNFVRKQDEGLYQLVVKTGGGHEITKRSICAQYFEQEDLFTMEDDRPLSYEEEIQVENKPKKEPIRFHEYHSSNVVLIHENTLAKRIKDLNGTCICFTDRPIKVRERLYVRVAEKLHTWCASLDFGLTNTDPCQIYCLECEHTNKKFLKNIMNLQFLNVNDILCFSFNEKCIFSIILNGREVFCEQIDLISNCQPMWLVFELTGDISALEITTNHIKVGHVLSLSKYYSVHQ